jgi:hypothetical protein
MSAEDDASMPGPSLDRFGQPRGAPARLPSSATAAAVPPPDPEAEYRAWEREGETPRHQIGRLGQWIMENVPGEPSRSEGAVDCAIRLLRGLQLAPGLRDGLVHLANEYGALGVQQALGLMYPDAVYAFATGPLADALAEQVEAGRIPETPIDDG